MADVLLPIAVIVFLVLVNGLFVAAEFALVASRRNRLQTLADSGSRAAQWLLKVFDKPAGKDGYIAVAQLGITLASIGLGMYGEPAVASWIYAPLEKMGLPEDLVHSVGFVIALSAITYLHVVFGEMIPKALALQTPEKTSVLINLPMRLFDLLFRPMVVLLNKTAFGLMHLLGIRDPGKQASLYTSKELAIVTEEAAQSGQMDSVQQRLITNIFEMEDRTAEELMTSRKRMFSIDVAASPEAVADTISKHTQARYPVYRETLDDVIGVLHVKDFIRAWAKGGPIALERLVRPLPSVAATSTAEELVELFKRGRVHAALVVDEFGGTLGFVTMEDVISNVIEEEDTDESPWVVLQPDGSWLLDGEVTLSELEEDHDVVIENEDVATIAGVLLSHLGTVPEVGTRIELGPYALVAEEVSGLKITKVRLIPLAPPEPTAEEDASA
ncbi:MAG: hemolysin family protein [Brachymonas sp.]|nr:hemolysin family protein [Brachymonas sp.]